MKSDDKLFASAYIAIIPFDDVSQTKDINIMKMLNSQDINYLTSVEIKKIRRLNLAALSQSIKQLNQVNQEKTLKKFCYGMRFFQTRTRITLINSSDQKFNLYHHPTFGKRIVNKARNNINVETIIQVPQVELNYMNTVMDFINGFHDS